MTLAINKKGGRGVDQPETESIRRSVARELSGGIAVPLLAGSCVLFVLLSNLTPLVVNDFWTQSKVGEIIRETGRIPDTVLFAFGEGADLDFIAYEWLPSVAISLTHSNFGIEGVVIVRASTALLVFALLALLSLQINRDLLLSLLIAIASILVIACRLSVRPEAYSFVFGLLELNLLQAYVRTKDRRWLVALLPLAVLWANSHGSFPVGIALALIFAAGEFADGILSRGRPAELAGEGLWRAGMPFAVAGLAMAVVSLINPFGWDLFEKVLSLTQSGYIRENIIEWEPVYAPVFLETRSFVLYLLYILLVAASLIMKRRVLPARLYLLTGVFLALSIDANRHVAWFAVAGSGVLAHTLVGTRRLVERRQRNAAWFAGIVLVGCVSTFTFGNVLGLKPGLVDLSPPSRKAIEFIRKTGYSGNVFNTYMYGGKLAYHFYPDIRIAIDDRIDAYGEDYYRDFVRFDGMHLDQLAAPEEFLDYFEENELNLIVVRTHAIRGWRWSGRLALLEAAGWTRVYADAWTRILRRDPDTVPARVRIR